MAAFSTAGWRCGSWALENLLRPPLSDSDLKRNTQHSATLGENFWQSSSAVTNLSPSWLLSWHLNSCGDLK